MATSTEVDLASIVIRGSFNPAIITPHWMASVGLIHTDEAEAFDVEVIHPQISKISNENFRFEVAPDRFAIETANPPHVMIRDLALEILGKHLSHTPLGNLGINRIVHFRVESAAKLMEIGEMLAPRAPWGEWGNEIAGNGAFPDQLTPTKQNNLELLTKQLGGVRSLTMEQSIRTDEFDGRITARIEPSQEFRPGIFMDINDHYHFGDDVSDSTETVLNILTNHWETSQRRTDWIIDQIKSL